MEQHDYSRYVTQLKQRAASASSSTAAQHTDRSATPSAERPASRESHTSNSTTSSSATRHVSRLRTDDPRLPHTPATDAPIDDKPTTLTAAAVSALNATTTADADAHAQQGHETSNEDVRSLSAKSAVKLRRHSSTSSGSRSTTHTVKHRAHSSRHSTNSSQPSNADHANRSERRRKSSDKDKSRQPTSVSDPATTGTARRSEVS